MTDWKERRILFGGDYNPDQWDRNTWLDDLRLMEHFHVNTVTLPVFSWARLQPAEDRFDFPGLDEVIEQLTARGISIVMATPTAASPAWMIKKYPEVSNVNVQGQRMAFGARTNFCPNSPVYRRLSRGMAAAMAGRYRDRKNILLWHVNNEYGTPCYCDTCAAAFRKWLEARYGSIENLNRRWYTAFWGHTFYDWEEIAVPSHLNERLPMRLGDRDGTCFQPITIDYHRFISDSLLACFRNEASVIREAMPGVPVTTNFMGTFKTVDYFSWAGDLDIVSWDNYPTYLDSPDQVAFRHDLMRGLRHQPFILMEQTPNQQNWQPYNTVKRPGVMRLWSYQALAHGSESVLFFQWRQSLGACEKFHAAMVPHCGHENTRIGRELTGLGGELVRLENTFAGSQVQAHAAVLFDWSNWWAVDYSSGPSQSLTYVPQVEKWYRAFHRQNIALDVVHPTSDLSGYRVVVAPVLVMANQRVRDNLRAFIEGGGVFITTFFSGIVDENDLVVPGGCPGAFRDLLGLWVEETDALPPGKENRIRVNRSWLRTKRQEYTCGLICDLVHPEGAKTLAVFGDDFYAGSPAVLENSFGKGRAVYIATDPAEPFIRELVHYYSSQARILSTVKADSGVEIVVRKRDRDEYLFVLNHNRKSARVRFSGRGGTNLLTGKRVTGQATLPAHGVMIIRES